MEDLGDAECCLAANAVVLVLGLYQISIATYGEREAGREGVREELQLYLVLVLVQHCI